MTKAKKKNFLKKILLKLKGKKKGPDHKGY